MSGRLLDTVTVSELRKLHRADARVIAWEKTVTVRCSWISVITLNEILTGIRQVELRDPEFAAKLDAWYRGPLCTRSKVGCFPWINPLRKPPPKYASPTV